MVRDNTYEKVLVFNKFIVYQKLTARFLLAVTFGNDWTSCHQKEGKYRTSPSSRVQFKG